MKIESKKDKIIKSSIISVVVVLLIIIIGLLILKYQVEGETNMPFSLSKIMVFSTAEGVQKEESTVKWDMNIMQNNDIYLEIVKNKNYRKTEIIKNIVLDNFKIVEEPKVGSITIYRPTIEENKTFNYSEDMKVEDRIVFEGSDKTDLKNLQIANQGSTIIFRVANQNISSYVSDEDDEIIHDGSLLTKTGINIDDIKYTISFDITINLISDKSYKGTITLEMPVGDIVQEGASHMEKRDCTDIVFKRQ